MNRSHHRIEIILSGITIVGAIVVTFLILQLGAIEPVPHVDFIIQFSVISTFVTAICISGASYAGMFYAQERFAKDIIVASSLFNLGINFFFHMISHPGSYFSRWIELSMVKSDMFLVMGFYLLVIGVLLGGILGTTTLSSSSERIIGMVGFLILPVVSAFLTLQELGVFVLQFDQNLVFAFSFWSTVMLCILIVIALLKTAKQWKERRNSTVLGTLQLLVFLLIAAILKVYQIFIAESFLPIEIAGVYAALFGTLVFAISLLGTSMVDPHWRK